MSAISSMLPAQETVGLYRKKTDLAIEIKALWRMKKVLGNFTERLEGYLKINIWLNKPYNMQKTVLLPSASILRKVLER